MTNEHDRGKLYELLIQELDDFAVFLVDLDGRITSWNPGVERFFGYPEAEFIGKDLRDIFTPEDRAAGAPQREMTAARQEGRAADVRWHLCRDQSRVFVEGVLSAVKNETGELVGYAKIARAVRPRHTAGSMITTLIEGTEDAMYAVDRDGRFIFANAQTAALLGRSIEDLLGHSSGELLSPSAAADLRAADESIMRGSHARLVEERFQTKDRGERVMLTTKAPWHDPAGKLVGLVAIAKDITARAAHQGERDRLLRELRRSNQELAAFSHVVAHDLRTPLRAVRTYAEMLERHLDKQLDPTSRQFMNFMMEDAEHMERLIESLLRYAESDDELSLQRVNVNAVVEGLLRRLEPLIAETNASITVDALPQLRADPVRLLQLFQNLIVNAINYRSAAPPRIHISAEKEGSEYRFAVADNGIGIAREHYERIFTPLKRLHGAKDIPLGYSLRAKSSQYTIDLPEHGQLKS